MPEGLTYLYLSLSLPCPDQPNVTFMRSDKQVSERNGRGGKRGARNANILGNEDEDETALLGSAALETQRGPNK